MKASGRQRGFTLVEVLVATSILAFSMAALLKSAAEYAFGTAHVQDRVIARLVAENALVELQTAKEWASVGTSSGEEEMVGREWFWRAEITEIKDNPDLRKVHIKVVEDTLENKALAELISYISPPELLSSGVVGQ